MVSHVFFNLNYIQRFLKVTDIEASSLNGYSHPPPPQILHHHIPQVPVLAPHQPQPSSMSNCGEAIREVWAHNVYEEFKIIRALIKKYRVIAMDTEFPGVVARPIGEFRSIYEYQYQVIRLNVDMLQIIQLGLTFLDDQGNLAPGTCTWQFNFKFFLQDEMFAKDSIELLQNSGIQFQRLETEGIDVITFCELFLTSGIVLNDEVQWLSFHSGYDFAYLLKIMMDQPLPSDESSFFELMKLYFPNVYDIKYLMKSCKTLKGGLQEVAAQLDIERVGTQHQAGSDSLITGLTFYKMKEMFFEDNIDEAKYGGHLYGFASAYSSTADLSSAYAAQDHSSTGTNF